MLECGGRVQLASWVGREVVDGWECGCGNGEWMTPWLGWVSKGVSICLCWMSWESHSWEVRQVS